MAGEVRTCKYLLRAQRRCMPTHFGFECRHELVAAKRYRKPYGDSANIKQTDMKRTFLDNLTERLTARPTSQRNEVIFFATAHFLFFNFFDSQTKHTFIFFRHTNPTLKKMKECFRQLLILRLN